MATISGKKTVTTAGTAVALGSGAVNGALMVKALLGNTGNIYIGNVNGDVASTNGLELDAGEVVIFEYVGDLSTIYIDSDTNGEGVTWLMLSGPVL